MAFLFSVQFLRASRLAAAATVRLRASSPSGSAAAAGAGAATTGALPAPATTGAAESRRLCGPRRSGRISSVRLKRFRLFCRPSGGAAVRLLASSRSALLSAAGFLVHGGPGAPLRLTARDATLLIPFLDMLRLTLLLARIRGLIPAWHDLASSLSEPRCPISSTCGSNGSARGAAVGWVTVVVSRQSSVAVAVSQSCVAWLQRKQ